MARAIHKYDLAMKDLTLYPNIANADIVYLSPHLDDVILGAGGTLHLLASAGIKVCVLSIFAGQPNYTRNNVGQRKLEDIQACAQLGVTHQHLQFLDAIYRKTERGLKIYPTLSSVVDELNPRDEAIHSMLGQVLKTLHKKQVIAPAGRSQHVDHLLVRRVYDKWLQPCAYYDDYPYFAASVADVAKASQLPISDICIQLDGKALHAKQRSIECYASQLDFLFSASNVFRTSVTAYANSVGGELHWFCDTSNTSKLFTIFRSLCNPRTSRMITTHSKKRLYWLPTVETCRYNCTYCEGIGSLAQSPKDRDGINRSLHKARRGGYAGMIVPCNVMLVEAATDSQEHLIKRSDTRILLNTAYSTNDWVNAIAKLSEQRNEVIILIDGPASNLLSKLKQAEQAVVCIEYWLVLRRGLSVSALLDTLSPSQRRLVRFYGPQKIRDTDEYLTCSDIYQLGETLLATYPEIIFEPPAMIEPYQPYIDRELELDPIPSLTQIGSPESAVFLSIIIPSYNSGSFLKHCVNHLLNQVEVTPETYELIVVDDGSDDNSARECSQLAISQPDVPHFTLISLERPIPRTPGDSAFRAGIARNVGARYASGKSLVFIDADILVSKLFVKRLLFDLRHADVVQAQRHYLTFSSSQIPPLYEDISTNDCYVPDEGYWHTFYSEGQLDRWNSLDHAYKYVCSYCLAMPAQLFLDVGEFRRTFAYYGFEDTELGYRLLKHGVRFHLSNERVYHLEPSRERSEYGGSESKRNELLRHSARWFYRLTLDNAVYRHFQAMM